MRYVVSCHWKRVCCSYRALCLAQVTSLESHSAFLPVIALWDGDASVALSTVSRLKNSYFSRSGKSLVCCLQSTWKRLLFFWENEIPHEAGSLNTAYHWVVKWGYFTIKAVVCLDCPYPLRLIPFKNLWFLFFNVQVTATWRSGRSGAPASSPASMAGASRQWGGSPDPGPLSFSLPRTRRAAPGKRCKHGLAQVVWPERCFLPFKSLFWFCCKVKADWYWYCRREVLWLPVENQPLARQRTHRMVSALRWNKCHRYVHKLPRMIMNEKVAILPSSSRISVQICV